MSRRNIILPSSPHLAGELSPAEFFESSAEPFFSAEWNSLSGTTYDPCESIIMDSKRARVPANFFSWLNASDEFDSNFEGLATKRHKIRFWRNENNSYYDRSPPNVQERPDESDICEIYSALDDMSTNSYHDFLESLFEEETWERYQATNKNNRKLETFHDYFTGRSRVRTAIHYFKNKLSMDRLGSEVQFLRIFWLSIVLKRQSTYRYYNYD
ncbi:hypothetical protein BZL39_C05880 [Zygosaccharomyces parabailii]|uniref:BN860_06700g1_1 n=1 Tax=Zygosaccharomyces bailii (strain CLIB 213 / ATCC 58445 / CBS 680 / BCRC 21525 / NBRC 1098 / NCYC 1416 / NRRL Y-2227) TaxID=1333698 RepID=A0A8J2X5R8_ZYGB2|nr:hypothetical protein BZL39_C05880 [Zygosaccharomyces parabailii]CDF87452.1 BN860_06700g1_1 [Zygosaccharomyces bailii CLIB 213]CDH09401.1 uncharacterized protein ZBAI_01185 [Zygosaccharomyces bailii ISA1307]SJM85144.1 uncharacterized protein ZBIST_2068 [Zygosaccharomyces bailii]